MFRYTEISAIGLLPQDWQAQILEVATTCAKERVLRPISVTSRESSLVEGVLVRTVGGITVGQKLPWLVSLYKGAFRDFGAKWAGEPIYVARDQRIAVNLNVQYGLEMRYECHVDSNPVEGLLYVTDHSDFGGGELIVAHDTTANSVDAVEKSLNTKINPVAGNLVFFDAREHPHYVRPLSDVTGMRVVVAMNYYTTSCTEEMRPPDLNRHLFGEG